MTARPALLTPAAVQRYALWRVSLLGSNALREHLARFPDLAWHVGEDYALGALWRGRPDVGEIFETAGRAYRADVIEALVEAFRRRGCRAVLVGPHESFRRAAEYRDLGWPVIDDVVFYRYDGHPAEPGPLTGTVRAATPADRNALAAVDAAAFDWLWRESPKNLAGYLDEPGRLGLVVEIDGRVVAYLAGSVRARAANFDRLGVLPECAGRGIGRGLLLWAIAHLQARGVFDITLNTQGSNARSRALYERIGFASIGEPRPLFGRVDLAGPAA